MFGRRTAACNITCDRIQKEKEEAEAKKQEEDAKRIRTGLKAKTTTTSNACENCQKVCKGKSRSQMFSRIEYVYCSTDCVRKHQRELTAAGGCHGEVQK